MYPIDRLPPASSWAAPVSKVPIRHGLPASTGVWSLQRQLNKRIDKLPPGKQKNAKKMPPLRIASWNVRTMRPGLSNDLQQINDSRKTAIIDSELDRLIIDIATFQEPRLAENGSLKEQRYTFFWQGKGIEEKREHGAGVAVKNSLPTVTEPPVIGSARILTIRLSTRAGGANIMIVYAPTLRSTADSKDQFYEELDVDIGNIPKTEQLYILRGFNARVGADHEAWPTCPGHHGMGKLSKMGRDFLSTAAIMDCQSLTHSSRTNHVTKCPGEIPGRFISINSILSSPDVMLLTMFSTHAATTECGLRIATLITR